MDKQVRIGCASGFWGDTDSAALQLVERADIDYLVFDYLAEITLSILAAARQKDPAAGYATDFVTRVMAPLLPALVQRQIKVVSNAGGINPLACRDALLAAAARSGLHLHVAVVRGDDLLPLQAQADLGLTDLDTGTALPAHPITLNAYLGAPAVARALALGADVVLTGRVVDSALALGPLLHEHGWSLTDYDRLAQGSLAGHLIECGAQCTGGNYTDWESVPGYEDMGFPIVECAADGTFVLTKPAGTGGLVTPATVAEQLVYEIGDPRAYLLPDVTCDFSDVRLEQESADRVRVYGARGHAPTATYKVAATYADGFRCTAAFALAGRDAARKATRTAQALLDKLATRYARLGIAPLRAQCVEILGAEASYGAQACARSAREVVARIAVAHAMQPPLELFAREIAQAATGMAPGIMSVLGGRPKVSPVLRFAAALVPKPLAEIMVDLDGETHAVPVPTAGPMDSAPPPCTGADASPPATGDAMTTVPLVALAHARSGDKGDHANIGVIARRPEYLPYLRAALTETAVAAYFVHVLEPGRGRVRRYELPGISALNFLLEHSLGGGGVASLRTDSQGKAFAQQLLDFPTAVPAALLARRSAA